MPLHFQGIARQGADRHLLGHGRHFGADDLKHAPRAALLRLKSDVDQTRARLGNLSTQIHNLNAALAGGRIKPASVLETLARLESDRDELRGTEAKLFAEIAAENSEAVSVTEATEAVDLYQDLVRQNETHPDRIKSLLARFVDYAVRHQVSKAEGRLEVGLFTDPVAMAAAVTVAGEDSSAPGCAGEFQKMAHRLLPTKQLPPPEGRPLRDITPCYSRSIDRRKEFVLGPKPGVLKGVGSVDKKVWKQYQTHLSRTTPLERAEFYAREMKERRMRSFRALSLLLGEPRNRVGRYMSLLDLPEPVKAFLRQRCEPQYLRYFTENRLHELVRLGDSRAAWRRFQEMVREADRDAGIWRNNGQ